MTARFGVLASGSGGNSSVILADGSGLLIDIGLGPRLLASRLGQLGLNWSHVKAVLLTHTHGDHWKESTLVHLARRKIPLYCHPEHHARLMGSFHTYALMRRDGLLRDFTAGVEFSPIPGITCRPVEISHDSVPTFAFRVEGRHTLFGAGWSLGYASDLGCFGDNLVEEMRDVDLLALEFNHDVAMQRRSGRTRRHIERVLGDGGHLSNVQAAEMLTAHLEASAAGSMRHLVQLHLSGDCNLPALAVDAARRVLGRAGSDARVLTAEQDHPLPLIPIEGEASAKRAKRPGRKRDITPRPMLPGFSES